MSGKFDQLVATFRRYATLIEQALTSTASATTPPEFTPTAESATALQIERGVVLRDALLSAPSSPSLTERLIHVSTVDRLRPLAIVDRAGHHRPVYRPLLAYAWLAAFRIRYETLTREQFGRWDEALRAWADLLESELQQVTPAEGGGIPASRGASAAEAAWSALALHVAGKVFVRDAWTDLAADTFGRLTRARVEGGGFLASTASDNPELLWYHELAILHAAASYAVQAEDRTVARAVEASATYLFENVQPDHATTQPWGLFAFIWAGGATLPMADALLHAATTSQAPASDGVSTILLADALYCLRLFL